MSLRPTKRGHSRLASEAALEHLTSNRILFMRDEVVKGGANHVDIV